MNPGKAKKKKKVRGGEEERNSQDVQAKGKGRHTEATAQLNATKALSSLFFSPHSTPGSFLVFLSVTENGTKGHYYLDLIIVLKD